MLVKALRRILVPKLMSSTSFGLMNSVGFRTVAVEGNIASGKTEFLRFFENYPGVKIFAEPVEKWRDVKGFNTLDLMYTNPKRWSLTFQTYVQLTMLDAHTRNEGLQRGETKIMERSIYSAKYCFVENLYRSKLMEEVDYVVLTEWFNWIIKNARCDVDLIIYLKTKPETVYDRLIKRQRSEELKISLDYLKSLHERHEDWLINQKYNQIVPGKVITIDANENLDVMYEQYKTLAKNILASDIDDHIPMNISQ